MLDDLIKCIVIETVRQTLKELGTMDQGEKNAPNIMSPKQLADYMGVSASWVYTHTYEIPHEKRGNKTLFVKAEIDQWRQEQRKAKEVVSRRIIQVNRVDGNKRPYYKVV